MDQEQERTLFGLKFDDNTKTEIKSIANWAGFISYTVFGFIAIMLLTLVFAGASLIKAFNETAEIDAATASMAGTALMLGVGFLLVVFGAWFYFLFRASQLFKRAVAGNDIYSFNEGIKSLNVYFIIAIVLTAFSVFTGLTGLF